MVYAPLEIPARTLQVRHQDDIAGTCWRRPHRRYIGKCMSGSDLDSSDEPFVLFTAWLKAAEASEPNDPNAMALATVDANGMPDVRMVLLKGFDEKGFVFFTNFESAKGRELLANPKAALCFHWKSLRKQVRVRGPVSVVSDDEADAYFASRPRGSRIGAWASQQSRPLEWRFALEKAVAAYTARYAIGDIPRPPYWSGFRLAPEEIEFWSDGAFRLHDRVKFTRKGEGWEKTRLYP
jgi:pyridoxamine 5'-phosphate oxidase